MGEPMNIADLASRMIRLSGFQPGTDIPIRIIGTRPGERLHEELFDVEENLMTTSHPSILRLVASRQASPGLLHTGVERLRIAVSDRDEASARQILFELIAEPEGDAVPTSSVLPLHGYTLTADAKDEIPA
jgi:FlaA1/EpsC-like NDP-sugar epimerase